MDFKTVFGHDVYVDDSRVGYVANSHGKSAQIFFGGSKLGVLTSEGAIELKGVAIGRIEENALIFIRDRKVGKIDEKFDMRLDLKALTKAMEIDGEQ